MHIKLDSSSALILTKFWLPMSYPRNFIMKKCTSTYCSIELYIVKHKLFIKKFIIQIHDFFFKYLHLQLNLISKVLKIFYTNFEW